MVCVDQAPQAVGIDGLAAVEARQGAREGEGPCDTVLQDVLVVDLEGDESLEVDLAQFALAKAC